MNRVKEYFKDYDFLENFRLLKTNIKGDINGGITTAIIALPLALAFGVSSGLGAKAGLIGAIVVGLLASIFGGTPAQISGPTAPMTIIVATVIAQFTNQPIIVFAIIALAGIFQITFGLTKVGKYIQYMPYPVLSGFMSGIGIIIVLSQINPILGLEFTNNIGSIIQSIPHSLMNLNLTSTIIGCTTLILIYSLARMRISFPGAIIAIILATSASKLLHLDVVTIGDIPSGLPSFQRIPLNWNILKIIIAPAMTLAIMGLLDSLLTSLVADRLSEHKHNSNRELIGQGIGNLFSGLLGGLPGAGATIRTEVNIHNGGKTPLSGITYATVIFISMLFLGQWLRDIP
ncbi:MAG: solute carrier family 23 protein, partial [Candidatus Omnitrophota bacterium]|nr:solute carrier family 23 protein [Candidatus Omnitrophota bacterium]